jgi:ATP-dependent Lhr-like helicase
MQIGTIVGDAVMNVKFFGGGYIGSIEEWFVSKLNPGDVFIFSGRKLELYHKKHGSAGTPGRPGAKAQHATWMGGRLTLSAQMSELLREELYSANTDEKTPELHALHPVFARQRKESIVPTDAQFLIETFKSREGYHAIFIRLKAAMCTKPLPALWPIV